MGNAEFEVKGILADSWTIKNAVNFLLFSQLLGKRNRNEKCEVRT